MKDFIIDNVLVLVKNMTGKYAKITLERLENYHGMSPLLRKIVLDGFNDLYRDIERRANLLRV